MFTRSFASVFWYTARVKLQPTFQPLLWPHCPCILAERPYSSLLMKRLNCLFTSPFSTLHPSIWKDPANPSCQFPSVWCICYSLPFIIYVSFPLSLPSHFLQARLLPSPMYFTCLPYPDECMCFTYTTSHAQCHQMLELVGSITSLEASPVTAPLPRAISLSCITSHGWRSPNFAESN